MLTNRLPFFAKDFKKQSFEWNGETRNYYLHAPNNEYNAQVKFPLLIMLHGRLGSGIQVMEQSTLNAFSDKENFIVVYPDGLNRSWADGRGNTPSDRNHVDDVGFIEILINKLSTDYSINKDKVFIAGHSNGGFMTQRMLLEKSNIFAGGVSIAAQLSTALVKKYIPKNPVSVAFIVGTADPFVPYYGGFVRDGGEILSAEDSFDRWKLWNECSNQLNQTRIDEHDDGTTVDLITHSECKNSTVVKLIRVNEGGHSLPGHDQRLPFVKMGKPTLEINAANEIVRFMKGKGI